MAGITAPVMVRGIASVVLFALLGGCMAASEREYTGCLTAVTAVGVGTGAIAGGNGASALGGGAVGSAVAMVVCRQADEAGSLEPPEAPMVAAMVAEEAEPVDDRYCVGVPAGVEVDEFGCPIPLVFDSRELNFAFDSAELPADASNVLQLALDYINAQPGAMFNVIGHTDSMGSDAYNNELSLRRARAVRDALVGMGVPSEQLSVSGEGESRPVATNETDAGRAKNRRVEIALGAK